MKNFIHFFYTPFTGLGLHNGYRGDDWFRHRIGIFKNYTLQGLLNQTNRDFTHWISFRPQEKENPLVWGLHDYLGKWKDYKFIFTFGGLCFWDDKYPNDSLLERLGTTLPLLKSFADDKKAVYMTIQPSDDIYHKEAVEIIQSEPYAPRKALCFAHGYIHSIKTERLAEWNPTFPEYSPPFYTLMFPSGVFLNPQQHFDYYGLFKSHEDIPKIFNYKRLSDGKFCVLTHGQNISTCWTSEELKKRHFIAKIWSLLSRKSNKIQPFIGREYTGREKEKILADFKGR